jgi:hypothetical protein
MSTAGRCAERRPACPAPGFDDAIGATPTDGAFGPFPGTRDGYVPSAEPTNSRMIA